MIGMTMSDIKKLIKAWSKDATKFVEEDLKVHRKYGGRGLSTQQKVALKEITKVVNSKIAYAKLVEAFRLSKEWHSNDIYEGDECYRCT